MEPLSDNVAECPANESEALSMVSGVDDEDGYNWTHACGWVHAPALDVWLALQDVDVVVDRRGVAEYSAEYDVEAGYDYSMLVHHVVRDVITVEYDVTYRHAVAQGDPEDPEVVGIRWQKTFGTSILDILEGSMVIRAEDDALTKLELIEHLKAPTQGPERIEGYFTDLFDDVVDYVNGRDLQEF